MVSLSHGWSYCACVDIYIMQNTLVGGGEILKKKDKYLGEKIKRGKEKLRKITLRKRGKRPFFQKFRGGSLNLFVGGKK